MYTASIDLGGNATITVDNGKITGDPMVLRLLAIEASAAEGSKIGPSIGPFTHTDHLNNDLSVWFLLLGIFGDDSVHLVDGEHPVPKDYGDVEIGPLEP